MSDKEGLIVKWKLNMSKSERKRCIRNIELSREGERNVSRCGRGMIKTLTNFLNKKKNNKKTNKISPEKQGSEK